VQRLPLMMKYGFSVALTIAVIGCLSARADSVDGSFFVLLTSPTGGIENTRGGFVGISTPFGGEGTIFTLATFGFDPATGHYSFNFQFDFGVDTGAISGEGEGSVTGSVPLPITNDVQDTWTAVGPFAAEYECIAQLDCPNIINLSEGLVAYDFSLDLTSSFGPDYYGVLNVTLQPAPEPGTLTLFMVGMIPLFWLSKRMSGLISLQSTR
jgi:hypothetical protein